MITGFVNAKLEARIGLYIEDGNGQMHGFDAVIDTGFTDWMCLPAALVASLGLAWLNYQDVQLVNGSIVRMNVYSNVEFNIEIDVAAFEDEKPDTGVACWTPPAPTLTAPMALITDVVEIAVYNSEAGPVLIGVIELVSPTNKDRPATRDAFVSKCASYLQQAIGLIVVDLVTNRKADLHAELLKRVTNVTALRSELWAAAYRPWQDGEQTNLQAWHHKLAIGDTLPTLPF